MKKRHNNIIKSYKKHERLLFNHDKQNKFKSFFKVNQWDDFIRGHNYNFYWNVQKHQNIIRIGLKQLNKRNSNYKYSCLFYIRKII